MRAGPSCCAIGLALASVGASAAEPPAQPPSPPAAPGYPFGIEVKISQRALRTSFTFDAPGALFTPPDPSARVRVGEQARDAYAAAARRMFRIAEPSADLELEKVSADLDFDDDGWHAVVEHAIVLRARGGSEVGRWTVKGREAIVGLGPRAMPAAFERAAEQAARRFEAAFEEPAGMAAWLQERGVEPGLRPGAAASAPGAAPLRPPVPPRSYGLHLDAGPGLYFQSERSRVEETASVQAAITARMGISAPWGLLQLALARSRLESVRGSAEVVAFGVEAGPVLRVGEGEIAGGVGVHSIEAGTRRTVTSVFGALRIAKPVSPDGTRLRLGLEVREDFGDALRVNVGSQVSRQVVPAASAWLLVGIELPLAR